MAAAIALTGLLCPVAGLALAAGFLLVRWYLWCVR